MFSADLFILWWVYECVYFMLIPLVEQIIAYVRRIVQMVIQATDLVQILYRGHPLRKKRGPRKISIWPPFSNMAVKGYPEILFFALKGQQMVEKDNDNIKLCFKQRKCSTNVINTVQMFTFFQYGCQYPRWPPFQYGRQSPRWPLKDTRKCYDLFWKKTANCQKKIIW